MLTPRMPQMGTQRNRALMHSEPDQESAPHLIRAILTDIQFWIPAAVLLGGIALLVFLH